MSIRSRRLKEKLATGAISPGAWMALPDPTVAEVMSAIGFDWIVLDAEHSPFNPETLQHILMGFSQSDTVPIIRVPWNDHVVIKQVLDMGWEGVLVPQVNSEAEARQAVAACRYPPLGNRGFGPRRAGRYYQNQDEYVRTANEEIILAIQIEHINGAMEIERIVAVEGIDWVLVGRYDMSGSMGIFGQVDNPQLWQAMEHIATVAKKAGLPSCIPLSSASPETLAKYQAIGCQLASLGEDLAYMVEGARQALLRWQHFQEKSTT